MEYIISSANAPTGDIYEDETYCTRGLCSHPCCWESHIRKTRGFRKYASLSADNDVGRRRLQQEDDSDDDLPTMKVQNMLDDYGDSSRDLYPSKHKGRPAHKQITRSRPRRAAARQRSGLGSRAMASVSPKTRLMKDIIEPSRKEAIVKQVEVQEVFDLEELCQNWDSTFLTRPMYVWIPGKRQTKKRKTTPRSGAERNPTAPDTVPLMNIDSELIPREQSQEQGRLLLASEPGSRQPIMRSRSPLPTGGQPYGNVGQTPKDRMRFRVIMNELKDLPRPFVIEVLEKARALDSKEDVLMLMERYLKTMRKSDWELSMVTGKVLQQQRLDSRMFEHSERLNQVPTSQIYKLDEGEHHDRQKQVALSAVPADVMEGSICSSYRYRPLPEIGSLKKSKKKKNTVRVHVSTTTQENVKPFQYKKQPNMEFCLGPTRSLSEDVSRPLSEKTLQSAREPTIPGADLSVLYDQESLDRNANNNAATKDSKMREGEETTLNQSRLSSEGPAAPAGTPYTPKTPYKEGKLLEKLEGSENPPSLEGVGLEVIQEQSAVDDFAINARKLVADPNLTTKSVIETRPPASPNTRRVVSAFIPRMETGQAAVAGKRAQSANVSMVVANTPSLNSRQAEQMLDIQQSGQVTRVTTSRLDVVSTTSNWPNVDEEALLREQTTPTLESNRTVSAPDKKTSKDKHRRPSTQPPSAKEQEPQTTSTVVNIPPLQMRKNSPAPPPPSPEPADKEMNSRLIGEDNSNMNEDAIIDRNHSDLTTAAVVDLSEIADLPSIPDDQPMIPPSSAPTDQSENDKQAVSQSSPVLPVQQDSVTPTANQSQKIREQQMEDLNKNLELSMNVVNGVDALSLVPDKLYHEMDMEREITLSVLPPSVLNTPELSAVNLRLDDVATGPKNDEEQTAAPTTTLPTLSEVMGFNDQGGLSGQ